MPLRVNDYCISSTPTHVLETAGEVVALTPEQSKYGAVETREESRRFRQRRDRIDGIIVTLPNFGEERAIADTLRLADLLYRCSFKPHR